MSWTLLVGLVLVLGLSLFATLSRRSELVRMRAAVGRRDEALRTGTAKARLSHPLIDLGRCLGCGTCVAACPEDDVLELVHGQALVVRGSACKGVSACERECPAGAITVTLANLDERRDVPALAPDLAAVGTPGLYLAGEVTAHALVRTAIQHGTAVAAAVSEHLARPAGGRHAAAHDVPGAELLELVIVGAGPAGLACSLEARRRGLRFVTLDQEAELGGTVARYPRGKLILTEPVDLPLGGRLERREYSKEELIELWQRLAKEHELPIRCGEQFEGLERDAAGDFLVRTGSGVLRTRTVCLAIGRRGTPMRLGVPGEERAHVSYSLLDAAAHRGQRVLVVGGGDSAVEAALGLAAQPGNRVTLSYRREHFSRLRSRNAERLAAARAEGTLEVLAPSRVTAIGAEVVELELGDGGGSAPRGLRIPSDLVLVQAGGSPPLALLEAAGVSFDPALRPTAAPVVERRPEFLRAIAIGFALVCVVLAFALWHADYYLLPAAERPTHAKHVLLRPGMSVGLGLGITAIALVLCNLLYVVRRSPFFKLQRGSLRTWMTVHVATGVLTLATAVLHGAMDPRNTAGGHALVALAVLVVTGGIGRYFYAWVPRAANGRELELEELKQAASELPEAGDPRSLRFANRAQEATLGLIAGGQWRLGFAGRVLALLSGQRRLGRVVAKLRAEGLRDGVPAEEIGVALRRARRAHAAALSAAHLEDLRSVLSTWRWLHRWVSVLMLILIARHVFYALSYGVLVGGGGG